MFWAVWLYTAYVDREQRLKFEHVFNEFHDKGERFTSVDGNKLTERIDVQRQVITALHSRIAMDEGRIAILEKEVYQRIHAIERRLEGVEQHLIRKLDSQQ